MVAGIPEDGRKRHITSLIFPTYNPGPILEHTWSEVESFLHSAPGNWEVLFVCDGCTDGTPDRLKELTAAQARRVRVLSYESNRGKGFAVRHGLAAARGQWRLFTDVDLAYGFDNILRLAAALRAGAEVAIASRTHPDSQMSLPTRLQGYAYRRHLQSLAFSLLVRCLLPLPQRDTQAGLKGISAGACQLLLPHLTCNGFGFDCELLTACTRYGLAVQEVPVSVHYEDRVSTTSFGAMGQMIRELWHIRRTWCKLPETPTPAEPNYQQRREQTSCRSFRAA
jgi:glycosyltransferase involved in cell wall biosynthesis